MLLSTQEPYTTRKESAQAIMNKIRELSTCTSINPDPNQLNTLPPSKNNKNYSALVTAYYDNLEEY